MLQIFAINSQGKKEINIDLTKGISEYKWVWADITEPTEKEIKLLSTVFSFHPLAIEDCINHTIQRPKLDYYHDHTFFITHALNERDFHKDELSIFIGDHFIVTFHYKDLQEINQVWNRIIEAADLNQWDQFIIFHQLLDKIVDNYFPILYRLEDELNQLEEGSNKNEAKEKRLGQLFEIKSQLLSLRHTINPMRDLLYRMINSTHLTKITERKEYFSDIYDHLLKLSEMVDSNREMTNDLRDSYLSLTAYQQNRIMQVLTVITTIFMPLTFIAGVYGMNFEFMPELTWKYGYFITLIIMGMLGSTMFLWFMRKGWFK